MVAMEVASVGEATNFDMTMTVKKKRKEKSYWVCLSRLEALAVVYIHDCKRSGRNSAERGH